MNRRHLLKAGLACIVGWFTRSEASAREAVEQTAFTPAHICVESDGTLGGTRIIPGSTTGDLPYATHRVREYAEGRNTVIAVELVIERPLKVRSRVFLPDVRQ